MANRYVINVAKIHASETISRRQDVYQHYFEIEKKDCFDRSVIESLVNELRGFYPKPEFKIEVTYWSETGLDLNI